jgi:hypothetical protein
MVGFLHGYGESQVFAVTVTEVVTKPPLGFTLDLILRVATEIED